MVLDTLERSLMESGMAREGWTLLKEDITREVGATTTCAERVFCMHKLKVNCTLITTRRLMRESLGMVSFITSDISITNGLLKNTPHLIIRILGI
jgi:hypothetical protein